MNNRFLKVARYPFIFQKQVNFSSMLSLCYLRLWSWKSYNIERKGYKLKNGLQMSCSPLSSPSMNNRSLKEPGSPSFPEAAEFFEHAESMLSKTLVMEKF